ncbi:MAG: LD-carboxypeptidase [Myxococcales bacterium]|nr:LD-carboxypeptidase [Myxococcales bacterium]
MRRSGAHGSDAWLIPEPLRPGARVRVVAPSGPFDHTLVWRGLAALAERYRLEFQRDMFHPRGFLAGDDERRKGELQRALDDPRVDAVIAARGGYGLSRIAPEVDWSSLRRQPKWLVGFSDITVMHLEASAQRVASLHAHNCAGLGRAWQPRHREWFHALERSDWDEVHPLRALTAGDAEGTLCGGNLTLLSVHSAARRLALPDPCVLLLEEVSEAPYHIDRMLTALLQSGDLKPVRGVVLGEFLSCPSGRYGVNAEQVLRERFERLGVPVYAELPVGHGERNQPLVLGSWARLHADQLRLTPPA